MHRRKVVEGRQPDVRRSDTESNPSNGILSDDIAQEKLVKGEHTGTERPDGTSILSVNIHPVDIVENHRDSKEARDSQVDSQATIVKYYSYSDKDQKGQIETKQLTMTNPTLTLLALAYFSPGCSGGGADSAHHFETPVRVGFAILTSF